KVALVLGLRVEATGLSHVFSISNFDRRTSKLGPSWLTASIENHGTLQNQKAKCEYVLHYLTCCQNYYQGRDLKFVGLLLKKQCLNLKLVAKSFEQSNFSFCSSYASKYKVSTTSTLYLLKVLLT